MPFVLFLLFAWALWERTKRFEAKEKYGELAWKVRRHAKDILLEQGREGGAVVDFCDRESPETLLFLLSPDGARERYRLPLHAREENGSFSDRRA